MSEQTDTRNKKCAGCGNPSERSVCPECLNYFMTDTLPEYKVERVAEALRGKSEQEIIEQWLA